LGVSLSASTVFDQCELVANALQPIFNYLKYLAAQAYLFLVDDTPNQILLQQPELREKRNGKGMQLRTGVYSSGLIAFTESQHEIVLFETSLAVVVSLPRETVGLITERLCRSTLSAIKFVDKGFSIIFIDRLLSVF
jgi:hypothetical protein